MSVRSVFNLLLGLLVVAAATAGGTYLLGSRLAQTTSDSASIQVSSLAVGTDYPGTVGETFVQEGDTVQAGEALFTIESIALQRQLKEGTVAAEGGAYTVARDGTMTFLAPGDGMVSELAAHPGSFVQVGTVLARVDRAETLYVLAQFDLTPREYARVEVGAAVELSLPNTTRLSGEVESVTVSTNEGRAQALVVVASPELEQADLEGFYQPGTPVEASMALRDSGPLAEVVISLHDFGKKIGL